MVLSAELLYQTAKFASEVFEFELLKSILYIIILLLLWCVFGLFGFFQPRAIYSLSSFCLLWLGLEGTLRII